MSTTTETTKQSDFPAGMIKWVHEIVEGVPGMNIPQECAPGKVKKMLYPEHMVARGFIFVTPEFAATLKNGAKLQIDRWHATVKGICAQSWVEDENEVRVPAVRVFLSDDRVWV